MATAGNRPASSGHASLVDEESSSDEMAPAQPRIKPQQLSLQPPSALIEETRSSFMTTSTSGSRMSGLSDFPVPPGDLTVHMTMLETYLEDGATEIPSRASPGLPASRRMTFGGDGDVEDMIKSLSSF
jgi:serine/arginine repetitive matrix protein 2